MILHLVERLPHVGEPQLPVTVLFQTPQLMGRLLQWPVKIGIVWFPSDRDGSHRSNNHNRKFTSTRHAGNGNVTDVRIWRGQSNRATVVQREINFAPLVTAPNYLIYHVGCFLHRFRSLLCRWTQPERARKSNTPIS